MKEQSDWRTSIVETATGPMVAILFWITVLLIVTMSIAHGKAFEANIFEAFGAIGQVAFAAAVFWLGRQQFEYTKRVTERQHKVDTYQHRIPLLNEYMELKKGFALKRFDFSVYLAFMKLARKIEYVYSRETAKVVRDLEEALGNLDEVRDDLEEATSPDEVDRARVSELRALRTTINKQVRLKGGELINAMRRDMRLDPE